MAVPLLYGITLSCNIQRIKQARIIVGHVPIELSSLTDYFLKADESISVLVEVMEKRKREAGLVFSLQRHAQVFDSEFSKKETFIHLELLYEPNRKRYPTLKLQNSRICRDLLSQSCYDISVQRLLINPQIGAAALIRERRLFGQRRLIDHLR